MNKIRITDITAKREAGRAEATRSRAEIRNKGDENKMSEFTPQYCAGCQTCGFQRDHILGYKDAQGHYLSVARAVAIINELEAKLESADRFLANQSLVTENDRLRDELRKALTRIAQLESEGE